MTHVVLSARAYLPEKERRKKDIYDGYAAYLGTFSVDEKSHVVIHHVEASLHPGDAGTDQK